MRLGHRLVVGCWAILMILMLAAQLFTSFAFVSREEPNRGDTRLSQSVTSSSASLQPPSLLDLSITPQDISVQLDNGTHVMFGRWVTISGTIRNLGEPNESSSFQFDVGIREKNLGYNRTLWNGYKYDAFPNETSNSTWFSYSWNVDIAYASTYEIWVLLDPFQYVAEANESNNFAAIDFVIEPLEWRFSITTDKTQYTPGENLWVSIWVTYEENDVPIPNIQPMLEMVDSDTGEAVPGTSIWYWSPTYDGWLSGVVTIPSYVEEGSYSFRLQVMDDWQSSSYSIEIDIPAKPLISSEVLAFVAVTTLVVVLFAIIYILDSKYVRKLR